MIFLHNKNLEKDYINNYKEIWINGVLKRENLLINYMRMRSLYAGRNKYSLPFGFTTSKKELFDLLKAWIIISLAFTIASTGFSLIMFLTSLFTVGLGFIIHEFSHKLVAQSYGVPSEFRSADKMLFFALLMSFGGFVFAAPGAVVIAGRVSREENGKISLAGPLSNLIIGIIFYALFYFFNITFLYYGSMINIWLALFNLLPFGNLDGLKVLHWNKKVYGLVLVACIIGFIII